MDKFDSEVLTDPKKEALKYIQMIDVNICNFFYFFFKL